MKKTLLFLIIVLISLTKSGPYAQANTYSVQFDNIDDHIDFGTHNLKQAYTVSFWIKTINPTLLGIGLAHKNPCSRGKGFHFGARAFASYNCPNACNPFGCAQFYQLDYVDLNNSDWKYKTVSNDGLGNLKLYQDGNLIASIYDPQSVFPSEAYPLWLGKTQDDNVFYGNTKIDNLEYWSICLNQSEILNYMNCPPTGNENGLWGFWDFETSDGNVVNSSGPNSIEGTLLNGASLSNDVPLTVCSNNSGENEYGLNSNKSAPAAISYQAVARDTEGQPLSNANLQVRFTLLTDSLSGANEYVETHVLSTNAFGLFNTVFGAGTPIMNTFDSINWTVSNKYLKVEIDAGVGFVEMGTQQLLSAPFAIRSNTAAKAGTIENSNLPVYSSNTQALAGGLQPGQLYRTASGDLKVVY
jgi:hypothetical protein